MLRCGPSSWGDGLTRFSVAPQVGVKDSHTYGPWDHVPPDKSKSTATQDEGKDEVEVCALCGHKHSTITVCGDCKEHYCTECINTHICGDNTIC